MLKTTVERTLVVAAALPMCAAALPAAELHPIVEVESGYVFGAISDGKWIKADETANSINDETLGKARRKSPVLCPPQCQGASLRGRRSDGSNA